MGNREAVLRESIEWMFLGMNERIIIDLDQVQGIAPFLLLDLMGAASWPLSAAG